MNKKEILIIGFTTVEDNKTIEELEKILKAKRLPYTFSDIPAINNRG